MNGLCAASKSPPRDGMALTQEHKIRLANALFNIPELSEADMDLVAMIGKIGDDRLEPYIVSQLRQVADRAPRFTKSLV